MNAAAIASTAAVVCADGVWDARCFREKRARNRRARGTVSEVRAFLKVSTVVSMIGEASSGLGAMAEGDMLPADLLLQFKVTISWKIPWDNQSFLEIGFLAGFLQVIGNLNS